MCFVQHISDMKCLYSVGFFDPVSRARAPRGVFRASWSRPRLYVSLMREYVCRECECVWFSGSSHCKKAELRAMQPAKSRRIERDGCTSAGTRWLRQKTCATFDDRSTQCVSFELIWRLRGSVTVLLWFYDVTR